MPYNKEELLNLPPEERSALAEELWSSLENEAMQVTDDEVAFAEERLKMHLQNPSEGTTMEEFKKFFADKHGF